VKGSGFSVGRYYNKRLLQWGGHIALMSINRLPRLLLTSWVGPTRGPLTEH